MVLVALLDDVAVLAVLLLVLWFFKVKFTLPIVTVIALLFGARVYMTYRAVKHTAHRKKIGGSEGMIGLEGEVIEALKPVGVIRVVGEYWKAKSVDGDTEIGASVEIMEVSRLVLEVRRKAK